jgi:hypothetical protein
VILNIALVVSFSAAVFVFIRRHAQIVVLWAALLLNLISLMIIARTALPIQPYFDFPRTQVTDFLSQRSGRVLSVTEHVLKPNANIVYGISSLRVHNPILPDRFAEFSVLCGAQLDEFRNQSYSNVTNFIDLASVKFLVSQFQHLPARYKQIFTSSEGISVYENVESLPESYLVASCRLASSKDMARAMLTSPTFDPRSEVILESVEQDQGATLAGTFLPQAKGSIQALSPRRINSNRVDISYFSPARTCLVLTDTFYPGWKAKIDGQESQVFRANFLFQAILAPAGKHDVTFEYDPLSFKLGCLLAAFSILVIMVSLVEPLISALKAISESRIIAKA